MGESSWSHAGWVSQVGKWAWVWVMVNGIINLIWGIYLIAVWSGIPFGGFLVGQGVWLLICGIVALAVGFIIIRPKFSKVCANQNWDALYDWVIVLGGARIPWMLIWAIVPTIFGYWGGALLWIVFIMLIFLGPRKYDWKA